jgi:uncharacterized protein YndB with AHSA1/START domain
MAEVSITRSIELEAEVDEVWEAISTPEQLSGWLEGEVDVDVRPGGDGVLVEPDGSVRRMRIDEVEPARRLALQWWPEDGSGPASTVEFDLEPTPGGTHLVVTETLAARQPVNARASAAAPDAWDVRLLLLGCAFELRLRTPTGCR